jgi:hypothetical protein
MHKVGENLFPRKKETPQKENNAEREEIFVLNKHVLVWTTI